MISDRDKIRDEMKQIKEILRKLRPKNPIKFYKPNEKEID